MADLVIVTYHSIDFGGGSLSRHAVPGQDFEAHLEAISRRHHLITPHELQAIGSPEELEDFLRDASRDCWILTFDDGYAEHVIAAERLHAHGTAGIFFVTTQTTRGEPLLANKIHLLDLRLGGLVRLAHAIAAELDRPVLDELIAQGTALSQSLQKAAFDSPQEKQIKLALQELDSDSDITAAIDRLVERCDPRAFGTTYASAAGLQRITEAGSLIGGHGATHRRLARMSDDDCAREIAASRVLVDRFHPAGPRHFAHPYGTYSGTSVEALVAAGFEFLYTIEEGRNPAGATNGRSLCRIDAKRIDAFV